ncbi:hypothetical protein Tco_0059373 [Tanacetum coccineum]
MYTNLYLFTLPLADTDFATPERWVPHLLEQNPETATSIAVNTILTAFSDAPFEASLARWVSLNDFPKEYFVSNTCLPSLVDNEEARLDELWTICYGTLSVVFHHVATDGWCSDLDDNEVMKSEMMAFWDGLNLPYHIRLMEILPVRS